jgi:hypothetical protein
MTETEGRELEVNSQQDLPGAPFLLDPGKKAEAAKLHIEKKDLVFS